MLWKLAEKDVTVMRERALQTFGFVAGLGFAFLPLLMLLKTSVRNVDGIWYAGAVAFAALVIVIFAALLRRGAPGFAKGLVWSLLAFLPASLVLWSLVHLPPH